MTSAALCSGSDFAAEEHVGPWVSPCAALSLGPSFVCHKGRRELDQLTFRAFLALAVCALDCEKPLESEVVS